MVAIVKVSCARLRLCETRKPELVINERICVYFPDFS